ncbi:MAG: hypothetical protein IKL90_00430 [Alphaproteobacteria bacterium]|nr:hypothetical protein [Alphaproteobacteria bacterium]
MAEESFYTDKVTEYRKNSRFPTLSRYRDLINFLKNVFSDGIVTKEELDIVTKVERDILLEYELAADICAKLSDDSERKTAAERLLTHLYRCFVVVSFAKDRARLQHANQSSRSKEERVIRPPEINKKLFVKPTVAQRILLEGLGDERARIEADLPRIRRDLAKLTPEERIEYEGMINAALDHLERVNLENLNVQEMNRLLGFERYLKDEKARLHE